MWKVSAFPYLQDILLSYIACLRGAPVYWERTAGKEGNSKTGHTPFNIELHLRVRNALLRHDGASRHTPMLQCMGAQEVQAAVVGVRRCKGCRCADQAGGILSPFWPYKLWYKKMSPPKRSHVLSAGFLLVLHKWVLQKTAQAFYFTWQEIHLWLHSICISLFQSCLSQCQDFSPKLFYSF